MLKQKVKAIKVSLCYFVRFVKLRVGNGTSYP